MFWLIIFLLLLFPHSSYAQSITVEPSSNPSTIQTPTPVLNPTGGILLNEFMPNPDDNNEWVEIVNTNNFSVKIENWKIGDLTTSTRAIGSTEIAANSIISFYIGERFLNNDIDMIKLLNNAGTQVDSYSYTSVKTGQSWSNVNGSWCFTFPTKGTINGQCIVPTNTPTTPQPTSPPSTNTPTLTATPTSTLTPTPTKTITPTKIPTATPYPSLIIEPFPTEPPQVPSIEPTPVLSPAQFDQNVDPVLGIDDIVKPATPSALNKLPSFLQSFLPILFIVVGGMLLLTPLIISKIN